MQGRSGAESSGQPFHCDVEDEDVVVRPGALTFQEARPESVAFQPCEVEDFGVLTEQVSAPGNAFVHLSTLRHGYWRPHLPE